jgi:hypothetical protein
VAECSPNICRVLGLIPKPNKNKKKNSCWLLVPVIIATQETDQEDHTLKSAGASSSQDPVLNMILYLKDPKNSTQKLLDIINSYSKVAGYKINIEKSLTFLYMNNKQTEKEYMKTIPFTIASKKHQIPRCKPNKGCERPLQGKLYTSEERD